MNSRTGLVSANALRQPRTRISFDIDDTLACHHGHVAAEKSRVPAAIHRWLGEPLRVGTRALIRELRRRGCSIWIYTSSGRSPLYIRRWLLLHGIHVDGVVNNDRHRRGLAAHGFSNSPSKFPPAFGIDLHVDDSEGVQMEGVAHGFQVVVVHPDDEHWTQKVLDAVTRSQAAKRRAQTSASSGLRIRRGAESEQPPRSFKQPG